jgi:NSS family neurotransmitter:Na+ symporter
MAISRKRLILYASGLVAGFTISPYTFMDFPAFWIRYGITGFALWLVFSALLLGLAVVYTEIGQKRGQRRGTFVDIYIRKIKGFGFLLVAMFVLLLQAGFWSGETGIVLADAMKVPTATAEVFKLILLGAFFYALIKGREKNFYIIMASAFVSIFMAMTLTTYGQNINGQYSGEAISLLTQVRPVSSSMVIDALILSVLTMGMGAFFYYLLGNFVPSSDIRPITILSLGFVGSITASILAGVGYALSFGANANTYSIITAYANGEMSKSAFLSSGINALGSGFLLILTTALIFSTATRVLPTLEISLIVFRRVYKANRSTLSKFVLLVAYVVTLFDFNTGYNNVLYNTIIVMLFFGALFETLGAIVSETGVKKLIATEGAVFFLSLGIYKLIDLWNTNLVALLISLILLTASLWLNISTIQPGSRPIRVRG